ncbi:MAG: apolipoprotein N-acyltransferase, partial [Actinomycetota bacterium]|nr:apolipoprotein N-acyltransferase [Actinomycetota bacterium]
RAHPHRALRLPGVAAAVAAVAFGAVAAPPAPASTGRTVDVLAVQGNDLQRPSADARADDLAIAERMLSETRRSVRAAGRPDLTVWPESSIDRDPFRESGADLLPFVEDAAAAVGGQLLFGTNLDGPRPATFYNAVALVDRGAVVVDRYVKRRYVPFGEYVPLRPILGALPPLRQVPRDGVAGNGPHTIRADATGVAVAVCFETLFADLVRSNIRAADAGLLVAVTNDASFGRSAQSAQHIAQTQLRAVETGRWAVHAALSGGSALVDPDGRVRVRTGLFERATIRADVPVITAETPFLRVGDVVGTTARWSGLVFLAYQLLERRRRRARLLQDAA